MPIIGVLARIRADERDELWRRIAADPALTPFPIEEEQGRIGILIEAADLDEANRILRDRVGTLPGVLGTWPVYNDVSDLPGAGEEGGERDGTS